MNKYYTPDITEFHIGFEFYEENIKSELVQKTIGSVSMLLKINKELNEFKDEEDEEQPIRVKCLDREDIESLGFEVLSEKQKEEMSHPRLSRGETFRGFHKYGTMNSQIYVKPHYLGGQLDRVYIYMAHLGNGYHIKFEGTIKNKSELEKILKQIGYE